MTRLQKKCFIASMSAHILLAMVLLACVAFVGRHPVEEEIPPMISMMPRQLVDALVSGGGNPNVTTPPALIPKPVPPAPAESAQAEPKPISKPADSTPPPEAKATPPQKVEPAKLEPRPEPKPAQKPEPRKARTKSREPEPNYEELVSDLKDVDQLSVKEKPQKATKSKTDSKKTANTTPAATPRKHEIKINLTPVKTPGPSAAEVTRAARQRAEAVARQQAALEAYRNALEQRSSALDSVLNRLDKGLSSGTAIEMPGPGGEAFANYGLYVRSMYDSAWSAPQDAPEESAKVQIKVIVARDGRVVSSEITRKSGNPALDKSVQRALNAVQKFPPFPAESNDRERIFIINFDLKAKRQIG